MFILETDKLEKFLKEFRRYWQELIIVALVYAVIFLFRINASLHQKIETMQQQEIMKADSEKNFFIDMNLKLLKINDSILKTDTANVSR